jgi:phytoene/squalene synthetase
MTTVVTPTTSSITGTAGRGGAGRARVAGRSRAVAPVRPDPRWLALFDTLRRYPVPVAPLVELLEGVAMDLEPVAMPDFPALRRYCMYVAGGVGLMLGPMLGASSDEFDELGVGLGIAMQLTNILRDVGEDLDEDRVYLPADELRAAGLSRQDLERRTMTPALRDFLAGQVARARRYFAAADPVVPLFPDDGSRLTVRLMHALAGSGRYAATSMFEAPMRRSRTTGDPRSGVGGKAGPGRLRPAGVTV